MKSKIIVALVQIGLGIAISTISVGTLSTTARGNDPVWIPRTFVETYAAAHQPTVAGANVEWNKTLLPKVPATEITLPGDTLTYGAALNPRRGLPGETPEQYLSYLTAVARVRKYASGLLREWSEERGTLAAGPRMNLTRDPMTPPVADAGTARR